MSDKKDVKEDVKEDVDDEESDVALRSQPWNGVFNDPGSMIRKLLKSIRKHSKKENSSISISLVAAFLVDSDFGRTMIASIVPPSKAEQELPSSFQGLDSAVRQVGSQTAIAIRNKLLAEHANFVATTASVLSVPPAVTTACNDMFRKANDIKGKSPILLVPHLFEACLSNGHICDVMCNGSFTKESALRYLKDNTIQNEDKTQQNKEPLTLTNMEKHGKRQNETERVCIGREDEIHRLLTFMTAHQTFLTSPNNIGSSLCRIPVLSGPRGVGKMCIVKEIVRRITQKEIAAFVDVQIFFVDAAQIRKTYTLEEFPNVMNAILTELQATKGRVWMLFNNFQTLFAVVGETLLKLWFEMKVGWLAITTKPVSYFDACYQSNLDIVSVAQSSSDHALSILRGERERLEMLYDVYIQDDALVLWEQLARKYFINKPGFTMPGSLLLCMHQMCASVKLQLESKPKELVQLERDEVELSVDLHRLASQEVTRPHLLALQKKHTEIKEKLKVLQRRYMTESKEREILHKLRAQIFEWKQKLKYAEYEKNSRLIAIYRDNIKKMELQIRTTLRGHHKTNTDSVLVSELITTAQIASYVSEQTNVSIKQLSQSESQRLQQLEKNLNKRVIGQCHAVRLVSSCLLRSRAGLSDAKRPIGVFLFIGPSGVGKTELCKAMAMEMFDDEKALIRFDMGEFNEHHTVARFFGSPPGYLGHEQGGQLTEAVKKKPNCVLLFDEIEKAHPQICDALLSVCDDGRLTDGKGVTVDFSQAIICMTSNLGTKKISEMMEQQQQDQKHRIKAEKDSKQHKEWMYTDEQRKSVQDAVKAHFRPEFIGRMDSQILFNPLESHALCDVVRIQLQELQHRLESKEIILDVSQDVVEWIISRTYNPMYGARPTRAFLQKDFVNQLTLDLITQKVKPQSIASVRLDANSADVVWSYKPRVDVGPVVAL